MPERFRIPDRRILTLLACALLASCASDRSANGTTGTEAGNALAVVLALPDGSPATQALVVARPSEDVDSTNSAHWVEGRADDRGGVLLHLGAGDWTLEFRCGRYASIARVSVDADTSLRDTLVGMRTLEGQVLGTSENARLGLPGLGRSVALDARGFFRFDDLPEQTIRLSMAGVRVWEAKPEGKPLLISAMISDAVFRDAVRLTLEGDGLATMRFVPDSLVPDSGAALLDSTGRALPMVLGGVGTKGRRVWSRVPVGTGVAYLCRNVAGTFATDSLFASSDGTRLEMVPDLSSTLLDLSRSGGGFVSKATLSGDSIWGGSLDGSLGSSLGMVQSGLPDTGAFAVSFQAKLLSTGIESLWLLDWSDSTGKGLRVGVGGRRLRLQAAGRDTLVPWDPSLSWFALAVAWDGSVLTVSTDGTEQLRMEVDPGNWGNQRATWKRRQVGLGGGIRLGRLTVRAGRFDADRLSRPADSVGVSAPPRLF